MILIKFVRVMALHRLWRGMAALVLMCALMPVALAQTCPVPPTANCVFGAGSANDYWPGSLSPASGATTVTLNARAAGGAGNTIANGDLVLLIQMQDADINSNNANTYGSGVAGNNGSGSTALNSAGRYQFVRATAPVVASGGAFSFTPALAFGLRTRDNEGGSTQGQARWQAIRVPPCATATASGVTAPAWNGTTGGVVALDVLGQLTLGGATAINVAGLGFRGGLGRSLGGGTGANTDYRTAATINVNASKGEGIAGTPRYMNNVATYNGAPVTLNNTLEGYPNGSYARGAPGNAGGGGTDGQTNNNSENTGGGGGGNYSAGGTGGNPWNDPTAFVGGRGGFGYVGSLSFSRIFAGGGGGAGTSNNGTGDNSTYTSPPGIACSSGALCSSGARGGGIVIVRAGSVTGSGVIDARGADGYNVLNDGGGGGGAGGSVVVQTYAGGSATINASGGNGGNAWRGTTGAANRHGPGGGGGGGFIAYSPSSGLSINATFNGGLPGRTSDGDAYGSTAASGGISAFDLPAVPGVQPAAYCPAGIKAVSLFADAGIAGQVNPGDVLQYTVLFRNGGDSAITGFNIADTLPSGLTYVSGSLAITASGGAAAAVNGSYNGAGTNNLLSAAVSLPAGGIIRATLRATVDTGAGAVCGNVINQAIATTLGLTDSADSTQNSNGLPAGTYITQAPTFATGGAADATGVVNTCLPTITKTKVTIPISDPFNGAANPRNIPGAIVEYLVLVTNAGAAMTANSVVVVDVLDTNTELVVTDIGGVGSGPVLFSQGTPTSGLTYTYVNPASALDDLEFFDAATGGTRITAFMPNALGCDAAVKRIAINPKGIFADGTAVGSDPSFQVRFRVCIK